MKSIVFAVVDKDYINPLRVMIKSFRTKNNIPFKIFKIGNFEIPDDLKTIDNVEYIDFNPTNSIKWVNDNFHKFNKDTFKNNAYDESKIIDMFIHLEIEDMLLKEYDVVFKTDVDIVYFDNIENAITNFFESGKPIGMPNECKHLNDSYPLREIFKNRKYYFSAGYLMINSKKCHNMFDNVKNIIEEYGFENFMFLDQDAINLYFNEDNIYNLINDGLINVTNEFKSKIPAKITSIHYNHCDKPFVKINNDSFINIISEMTILNYLKLSKSCCCDEYFLEIIKAHSDFIKNNCQILRRFFSNFGKIDSKIMRVLTQKINENMNLLIKNY